MLLATYCPTPTTFFVHPITYFSYGKAQSRPVLPFRPDTNNAALRGYQVSRSNIVCQNALKRINRLKVLSYLAAVVCLLIGIIIDARTVAYKMATAVDLSNVSSFLVIPPTGFWIAVTAAIVLAIIGYLLNKLSRLFYTYEFEHSHND